MGRTSPGVADITYIAIVTDFVYLAAILDVWSRRVIGCAISRSIASITRTAVRSMLPSPTARCSRSMGSVGSMGRRGNPYDNAKAESSMKTLKVEAVNL